MSNQYWRQVSSDLNSTLWNTLNPSTCPCRGRGWMLSDYDTWHACSTHNRGQPHPEACDDVVLDEWGEPAFNPPPFDYDKAWQQNMQAAFEGFLAVSQAEPEPFWAEVRRALTHPPTLQAIVDEAEKEAVSAQARRLDEEAKARGFSCRLEAEYHDRSQSFRYD